MSKISLLPPLIESTAELSRRRMLQMTSLAPLTALSTNALAQVTAPKTKPKEIRIGFQRGGILVIAQQQRVLEKFFEPLGIEVTWKVFQYSNPALEAVNAGSIDFSSSGNAPPIFAQAANLDILYAATQASGDNGEGIVVLGNSPIQKVADLKGKKVAVAKGTSAHYFLVAALENAGLKYEDVEPVFLAPSDAPTALSRGDVAAWAVWDPYLALAEKKLGGRVIVALGKDIKSNNYLIARRGFAQEHPEALKQLLTQLGTIGQWAQGHRNEIAAQLAEITGIDLEIQRLAAERANYSIGPITEEVVKRQQAVADQFFKLGVIPKEVKVRDAVWSVQG